MATLCLSCACSLESGDAVKEHYRTEWHRYNLRRKVAGLKPLPRSLFEHHQERQAPAESASAPSRPAASTAASAAAAPAAQIRCYLCKKSFGTVAMLDNHLRSKKHKDAEKKSGVAGPGTPPAPAPARPSAPAASASAPAPALAKAMPARSAATRAVVVESGSDTDGLADDDESEYETEEEWVDDDGTDDDDAASGSEAEEADEEALGPDHRPLPPTECLFCSHQSRTVDRNAVHMRLAHGFFLPDREYLADMPGLLTYLGQKVGLGHMCLYCDGRGKHFRGRRAAQAHMISKSHCKLRYEEGHDLEEFEDFYDFSASYVDMPRGADGALVDRTLEVAETGELQLLDGRIAGHREYRTYYRQRYRPADQRTEVVANQRERFMAAGRTFVPRIGWTAPTGASTTALSTNVFRYRVVGVAQSRAQHKMLQHQAKVNFRAGLRQNLTAKGNTRCQNYVWG